MLTSLLADNPLLIKHIRTKLRSPQSSYLIFVVFVICSLMMWTGFESRSFKDGYWFLLFVVSEGFVLGILGMNQISVALAHATETGILDFHRIAPLSPSKNAVGFLFGAPVREYAIVGVMLPFTLFCAVLAVKPSVLIGFFTVHLVMLSTTVLFHLIALTSGLIGLSTKSRGGNALLIGLLAGASMWPHTNDVPIATPAFLSLGPCLMEVLDRQPLVQLGRGDPITFFGLSIPYFIQSLIYQLPLIGFLFVPVIRRMRSADSMPFPKLVATSFLATVSILNLAGIVGRDRLNADVIMTVLMFSNLAMGCVLVLGVTPDRGQFRNHLRRSRKQNMLRPSMTKDEASNRSVVWMFAVVTYGLAQAAAWLVPNKLGQNWVHLIPAGTTIGAIMTFGFGLQWFRLRQPKSSTAGICVLLFLIWVLPLLIGSISAMAGFKMAGHILAISPLSGIVSRSPVSLVSSAIAAAMLWAVLTREESKEWAEMQPRTDFSDDEADHNQ
jgi:hypothetical protein